MDTGVSMACQTRVRSGEMLLARASARAPDRELSPARPGGSGPGRARAEPHGVDGSWWLRAGFRDRPQKPADSMLTILEGSTFCLCDDLGEICEGTTGLFAADTRYLSRLELRLDGARPLLLSSGKVEYFSAAFFLRNDVTPSLAQDTVLIDRRRFVGDTGLTDTITVRNVGVEATGFRLGVLLEADFADIFAVKERDFALGHPDHAPTLPARAAAELDGGDRQIVLVPTHGTERTQILLSRPCHWSADGEAVFEVALDPGASWRLRLDIVPTSAGEVAAPPVVEVRFGTELEHVRESLENSKIESSQRAHLGQNRHNRGRTTSDKDSSQNDGCSLLKQTRLQARARNASCISWRRS
jgi:hypothetical protein